jgi:hypothetical protein
VTRAVVFQEPAGGESTLDLPATPADWAVNESRFQRHFRVTPKGELGNHMVALADYVTMEAEEREGREAYVHFAGDQGRHLLAVVSPEMAEAARSRYRMWSWLRTLASSSGAAVESDAAAETSEAPPPAPTPPAPLTDASVHQALTERLLQLCGFTAEPEFFKQSLREFVVERNLEKPADEGQDEAPPSQ